MNVSLVKGFEIKRKSRKKLLSYPPLSQVYSSTALSKQEVIATWIISELGIFRDTNYGYIGNVGIKAYIPKDQKPHVSGSKDLDVALEEIKKVPKKYEIIKKPLIDKIICTHQGLKINYSPFFLFIMSIPPFQIDTINYETIDIFTPEVGIGPIPLEKEDFRKIIYKEYLPILPLEVLISSHINPLAFTSERAIRALFAAVYNPSEKDYIQEKLEKSIEVMKKLGKDFQYRKELERVSRECYKVERRVEKLISRKKTGIENIENAREICELLKRLYERF
jgi:hypothetical protein